MATTRRQLRQWLGTVTGEMLLLVATGNGSTTSFVDAIRLAYPDGRLAHRVGRLAAGTAANLGAAVVVSGNSQAGRSITFAPALTATTATGDQLELWNQDGHGLVPHEIDQHLDFAVASVAAVVGTPVLGDEAEFDGEHPLISIPDEWDKVSDVEWEDSLGIWHVVPPADRTIDLAQRQVQLNGMARWNASSRNVRLRGYTNAATFDDDDGTTPIDAEWLVQQAAATAYMALAMRGSEPQRDRFERRAQYYQQLAESRRGKARVRPRGPVRQL